MRSAAPSRRPRTAAAARASRAARRRSAGRSAPSSSDRHEDDGEDGEAGGDREPGGADEPRLQGAGVAPGQADAAHELTPRADHERPLDPAPEALGHEDGWP